MRIRQVLDSLNVKCIRGFLTSLYHSEGAGRRPYDPVSMLKAQILKYLRRVPSDRRLALLLKWNRWMARACGFKRKTPSHGLFTQFRHRLGRDGYEKVFSLIIKQLLKRGIIRGEVVAVDSTVQQSKRIVRGILITREERVTLMLGLEGEGEASS